MNWQLNKIADDLNSFERVQAYVHSYSDNGSIQGALDAILKQRNMLHMTKR